MSEEKELTPEEKARLFMKKYDDLVKELGFKLAAVPFETETATIVAKLRLEEVQRIKNEYSAPNGR